MTQFNSYFQKILYLRFNPVIWIVCCTRLCEWAVAMEMIMYEIINQLLTTNHRGISGKFYHKTFDEVKTYECVVCVCVFTWWRSPPCLWEWVVKCHLVTSPQTKTRLAVFHYTLRCLRRWTQKHKYTITHSKHWASTDTHFYISFIRVRNIAHCSETFFCISLCEGDTESVPLTKV